MKRPTHHAEAGTAVRLDDVLLVHRENVDPDFPYRLYVRGVADELRLTEEGAVELFAALRRHRG